MLCREYEDRSIHLSQSLIASFFSERENYRLPLYGCKVPAGFPSPADDWLEDQIDLNRYLIKTPEATFLMRVSGESMTGAGIFHNDVLVVDRSVQARNGHIVVAILDGEMTVKRLSRKGGKIVLLAENPAYASITLGEEQELIIWGVVISVLRKL